MREQECWVIFIFIFFKKVLRIPGLKKKRLAELLIVKSIIIKKKTLSLIQKSTRLVWKTTWSLCKDLGPHINARAARSIPSYI